jgi:hypothetical protein
MQQVCSSWCCHCSHARMLCKSNQRFLRDVSDLAPVSCGFSTTHVFGVFSSCLGLNLLLKTFSRIWKLFSSLEHAHQETWGICGRHFLWGRCLVHTSYRNTACSGNIPVSTEDKRDSTATGATTSAAGGVGGRLSQSCSVLWGNRQEVIGVMG